MKKVLSLVLVIAMVLSSMSFAFASPLTDIADNDYEDAINTLVGLGIINGYEDGTFRPERTVTRAQMAKMLVITLGYGDLVAGSKSNFADTQGHWADAYIALASGQGLVIGYPNGTFQPDKTIAYDEVMTMVVRALGYTDGCNEIVGTWPTNYKIKAAQLGLTDDVKLLAVGADRGGVAQLLMNALEATLVAVTTDGDVTFLQDQVGTDKVNRILLTRLADSDKKYTVGTDTLDKDSKFYGGDTVDLAPYMYQTINAYVSKSDKYEVVYVKDVVSLVIEGTVTDTAVGSITVEDASEKEHDIKTTTGSTIKTYFNGVENIKDATDLEDAVVTVVINDANKNEKFDKNEVAEAVVATKATGERKIKKEYVDGKVRIDTINLPEDDDEVDFDNLVIKGDASALEDIKKDSVVTLYEGKDGTDLVKLTLVVSNNAVEGKINKTNADKSVVTVDGTAYDMSKFADYTNVKAGAEGTFYLNAEGEIFAFDKEGSGAPKNYAVVVAAKDGKHTTGFGVEDEAQIKLATEKDETVTYKVDEDATIEGHLSGGWDLDEETLKDMVVEYELTSNGKIDSIKKADLKASKEFVPESNSFVLANNAVIFDGMTNDNGKYDYGVLSVEQLNEKEIEARAVYNDDGEIELLFVTVGVDLEKTGTYAIITNVELGVNDDDDPVYIMTAWVDGIKSEYKTTKKFASDNTTPSAFKSGAALREMIMKDGAVSDVEDDEVSSVTVTDVNTSKSLIKTADGWFGLSDDAVIYLQTGTNKVEVQDIYEIDIDDEVKLYDTDDTDDIEVVIIIKR